MVPTKTKKNDFREMADSHNIKQLNFTEPCLSEQSACKAKQLALAHLRFQPTGVT